MMSDLFRSAKVQLITQNRNRVKSGDQGGDTSTTNFRTYAEFTKAEAEGIMMPQIGHARKSSINPRNARSKLNKMF